MIHVEASFKEQVLKKTTTSVCVGLTEEDDDDLVYLGTGEDRVMIFTGRTRICRITSK